MEFDDLEEIDDLVHHVWDAAALRCLEREPLRYSELGTRLAAWSGRRPSDSVLTRTIKRLRGEGLINVKPTSGANRLSPYVLTDAGRARLAEIRRLVAIKEGTAGRPDAKGTSGQDTDASDEIMMPANGRDSADRAVSPWHARLSGQDGEPVDGEIKPPRPTIDTSVAHPARRYNYWLGGKDHFAADRKSGDELAAMMPTVRLAALENRGFQRRVVQMLAGLGIRQFLDIGTGIPAPDNTHEVAQAIAPSSRVVYVDNDPIVLAHTRALLTSAPEGRTAYIDGDLHEPDKILSHPDLVATLDLRQPVGLLLIAVLHFVTTDAGAYDVVSRLVQALPAGSFVAISHGTKDFLPAEAAAKADAAISSGRHGVIQVRNHDEVARFFDNLELLPPGIVPLSEWRPTVAHTADPAHVGAYGAVAKVA